mgnify:CR=1 FL=1
MNLLYDLPLTILPSLLAICRLPVEVEIPEWIRSGDLLAIIRTPSELSIVCENCYVPPYVVAERGWRAIKVEGPLDFSLIGVLSSLSGVLARAGVSLFALSTYDTDYVLVKESALGRAVEALSQAGYVFTSYP